MAVSPVLARLLAEYGLSSLTNWASNAIIQGWSDDQIILELYERPEFHNRFKGIKMLEAKGYPPISPDQYLQYEQLVKSVGRMWGMDITQDEIDNMIGNGVSPMEAEERLSIVGISTYESAPEVRSELERLYGIPQGELMRYWMNPKESLGRIQQQFRTGQIAGAALRTGYGSITQQQGELLANTGMNADQAQSSFSELVRMEELFDALSGNESDISQAAQIQFLAGDATVGQQVEKRAGERKAEFGGGSGFASGEEGFAVGSAD